MKVSRTKSSSTLPLTNQILQLFFITVNTILNENQEFFTCPCSLAERYRAQWLRDLQKYDVKDIDSQLVKEYAEALQIQDDSTAFGNLSWRAVFTDPALVDLIQRALDNNKDLRNAKLNIDIAHAQLKGARLSYLPSLAFTPNGAGAKYADNDFSWTYQLPLAVNWEVDIFGKILNTKRGAEMAELQSRAYEQAVRSQIIAGVAQCYYSISALEAQLKLSRETSELWKESVNVMRNLKEAGRLREDLCIPPDSGQLLQPVRRACGRQHELSGV